jgi:Ca2+-binding EF-hand superfamily protein
LLVAAALAAAPWGAWAADPQSPRDKTSSAPAAADVQDIVYLGDARPVFVRIRIQRDGKPVDAPWKAYIEQLFRFLDRDGDGVLSQEEAERAPTPQQLVQQFQNYVFALQARGGRAVGGANFQDMDPSDGKVTLAKLESYYRRHGAGPVQVSVNQGSAFAADGMTAALFKHLDVDRGSQLSKDKLAQAEKILAKLDINEDELISRQELFPNAYANDPRAQAAQVARLQQMRVLQDTGNFFLVDADDSPRRNPAHVRLAEKLLERYDKDKDQKLSRQEIGLDKAAFQQLDRNRDGQLDAYELMQMLRQPPHLELFVRLSSARGNRGGVELVDTKTPLAKSARNVDGGVVEIGLADARMRVRPADATPINQIGQRYRQFFVSQFKAADTNKDGCLDLEEIKKSRAQFYLLPVFQLADRDGDGKLSEKELNAFLDLLDKGVGCSTAVTINNEGRDLFAILDANGDGQLSVRELRTAWTRLAAYDHRNKGFVTRQDIPLHFDIEVAMGQANFGPRGVVVRRVVVPGPSRRVATAGPLWFRKMDRNGDGDVSPREFLGTPEDFKRIDTDGDGLISAAEATRADEWFRKKISP